MVEDDEPLLFPLPDPIEPEPKIKRIAHPIWTENKAKLIERYLYYFVLITKHGTYIDGFAGPQKADKPEMWAAKLVLESEPRWLKHFYLFDESRRQVKRLEALKKLQPDRDSKGRKLYRDIHIFQGDFNRKVREVLDSDAIKSTEATFCLLDQRTFECHWATLASLAQHKTSSKHKIELFYFLPIGWLGRALAALQNDQILQDWWGRDDWADLRTRTSEWIVNEAVNRLKTELRYKSVKPWPIFERKNGGNVMYNMIHATDHPDAPMLMSRAYNRAIQPKEPAEQILLEFGLPPEDV